MVSGECRSEVRAAHGRNAKCQDLGQTCRCEIPAQGVLRVPAAVRVVAQCEQAAARAGLERGVLAAELYAAFHEWSESQGVPDTRILSKNAFGRRLKLSFEREKSSTTRLIVYRGLALLWED